MYRFVSLCSSILFSKSHQSIFLKISEMAAKQSVGVGEGVKLLHDHGKSNIILCQWESVWRLIADDFST